MGLEAPALGAVLQAKLRDVLPERCPVANPVDYAGQAEEEPALVAETLDRALADDLIGGVLLAGHFGGYRQLAGPAVEAPELEAARRIGRIAQTRGKPVVIHSVYAEDDEPAIVALRSAHVPAAVRSLASAAILMRGMADWAAIAAWRASRTTAPRIEVDARGGSRDPVGDSLVGSSPDGLQAPRDLRPSGSSLRPRPARPKHAARPSRASTGLPP